MSEVVLCWQWRPQVPRRGAVAASASCQHGIEKMRSCYRRHRAVSAAQGVARQRLDLMLQIMGVGAGAWHSLAGQWGSGHPG